MLNNAVTTELCRNFSVAQFEFILQTFQQFQEMCKVNMFHAFRTCMETISMLSLVQKGKNKQRDVFIGIESIQHKLQKRQDNSLEFICCNFFDDITTIIKKIHQWKYECDYYFAKYMVFYLYVFVFLFLF